MNYLGLLALSLGLISVIISLRYITLYEKINKSMIRISNNCVPGKNTPSSLLDIQQKLDMTDTEFSDLLSKNINKIKTILEERPKTPIVEKFINPIKEGFQNIKYLTAQQRGLNDDILTNYITSNISKTTLKTPEPVIKTYEDELVKTREYIENKMDTFPLENPVESLFEIEKNWTDNKFYKTNWCMVDYNNKNYCFNIENKNDLCEFGEIVNNRSKCDF